MRIALEYNLVPSTTIKSSTAGVSDSKIKNSYIGVKFSVYMGGGKKK